MSIFNDSATTRAVRRLEPGDLWTITMTTSLTTVRITMVEQGREMMGAVTVNTGTDPDDEIPSQDPNTRILPNKIGLSSIFDTVQAVPGTHDVRIAVHALNKGGSAIFEVEAFS